MRTDLAQSGKLGPADRRALNGTRPDSMVFFKFKGRMNRKFVLRQYLCGCHSLLTALRLKRMPRSSLGPSITGAQSRVARRVL